MFHVYIIRKTSSISFLVRVNQIYVNVSQTKTQSCTKCGKRERLRKTFFLLILQHLETICLSDATEVHLSAILQQIHQIIVTNATLLKG